MAEERCTGDRRLEWKVSLGLGTRRFYEHYVCKTKNSNNNNKKQQEKTTRKKTKTAKTTTKHTAAGITFCKAHSTNGVGTNYGVG